MTVAQTTKYVIKYKLNGERRFEFAQLENGTAEEAKAYRLVNHVTEAGGALDKARELARTICANAPLSVMFTKSVIDRGMDMPLAEGMAAEGDVSFMLYFTQDRNEGLAAFRD